MVRFESRKLLCTGKGRPLDPASEGLPKVRRIKTTPDPAVFAGEVVGRALSGTETAAQHSLGRRSAFLFCPSQSG
jgi:hypothetical protein